MKSNPSAEHSNHDAPDQIFLTGLVLFAVGLLLGFILVTGIGMAFGKLGAITLLAPALLAGGIELLRAHNRKVEPSELIAVVTLLLLGVGLWVCPGALTGGEREFGMIGPLALIFVGLPGLALTAVTVWRLVSASGQGHASFQSEDNFQNPDLDEP